MCRPSCCNNSGGQGAGAAAVAVIIGSALIAAEIGPVVAKIVHTAVEVICLVALTMGLVLALAAVTWVAITVTRWQLQRRKVLQASRVRVVVARHSRQILDIGLARDNAIAAAHGWNAQQVKPGTWSNRDPRFIFRTFERTQDATGCAPCDDKIAEWFSDAGLICGNRAKARRWS